MAEVLHQFGDLVALGASKLRDRGGGATAPPSDDGLALDGSTPGGVSPGDVTPGGATLGATAPGTALGGVAEALPSASP